MPNAKYLNQALAKAARPKRPERKSGTQFRAVDPEAPPTLEGWAQGLTDAQLTEAVAILAGESARRHARRKSG